MSRAEEGGNHGGDATGVSIKTISSLIYRRNDADQLFMKTVCLVYC